MSVTEIMEQPQDSVPPPKRSSGQILLWIALAIIAFMAVITVLAVSLVVLGRSSSESDTTSGIETDVTTTLETAEPATTLEPAETATTVAAAPTEESTATTTSSTPATPRTDGEAEELLLSFSEAWQTANWDEMATFASDDVVATAREWYSEGGEPSINKETLEFIFESCTLNNAGATSCSVLYAPPDGFGLIFDVVYADNGSGLTINQLTFGGDAG